MKGIERARRKSPRKPEDLALPDACIWGMMRLRTGAKIWLRRWRNDSRSFSKPRKLILYCPCSSLTCSKPSSAMRSSTKAAKTIIIAMRTLTSRNRSQRIRMARVPKVLPKAVPISMAMRFFHPG